ncbi:UvrD-helicase domain-containing protein [Candidatus Microgenomates bacterium]|nr:UvrD-helicase domain-containing protein [Candidatus Microgenomates bacterium]
MKIKQDSLNPEQQKAVETIDGPILILAGAGSGKTRVITYRIAHLIAQGIKSESILAVTFTNKAAGEMKERVEKLLGNPIGAMWIGTFHSICVRILRREIHHIGYDRSFTIYDSSDQQDLIKECLRELGSDEKMFKPRAFASRISGIKNEFISPIDFAQNYANTFFDEKVAEVYAMYQKKLRASNALDFDDLIGKTIEILQNFPEIRAKYQRVFHYILVDEYQDTNRAQYLLVKLLVNEKNNICVVGDPDQSIYNFRGADIRNILNFEKDYPDTKIFKLEENYRSTQKILLAAQKLIENNRQRKSKDLWTKNNEGEAIGIFEATNERDEGIFVCDQIKNVRRKSDASFNDFVVFYRTHAQSRALEEAFLNSSVPYRIVGGTSFYERMEVKDIIAYLRIIQNPSDFVSLSRIINKPARGIGETAFAHLKKLTNLHDLTDDFLGPLDTRSKKSLGNFKNLYERICNVAAETNVSELITAVAIMSGYKEMILDGTKEGDGRWENIRELLSVAQRFDNLGPMESLTAFLQDIALITNLDNADFQKDAVSLLTLHSAKGLEFDYVFIVGMEESIFPSGQAMNEDHEIEEERRLCYVGITRARKKLFLLYARTRLLYGGFQNNLPSRFLSELPEDAVEHRK